MDRIKYFKWIFFREMTAIRGQHIANLNRWRVPTTGLGPVSTKTLICRDYVDDCF